MEQHRVPVPGDHHGPVLRRAARMANSHRLSDLIDGTSHSDLSEITFTLEIIVCCYQLIIIISNASESLWLMAD